MPFSSSDFSVQSSGVSPDQQLRRPYEEYELDDIVRESVSRSKRRSCLPSNSKGIDQGAIIRYCGAKASGIRMFGVVFPNRSFPMDVSSFTQIDTQHWILDMNVFVGEAYDQVNEMCIFLLNSFSLPPEKALAVYVQSPGSAFQYCGAVCTSCPSAVLSLLWPKPGGQMQLTASDTVAATAKIGIAAEDVASLPTLNMGQYHRVEQLALKVGQNLFNYMQSFCTTESNKLVVPFDILDKWFKKFQERAKRDPDYLKQFTA